MKERPDLVQPMPVVDWIGAKAAVPVAAGAVSAPWWIEALHRWSDLAAALLPFLGICIALLTIWGKLREMARLKRRRRWHRG